MNKAILIGRLSRDIDLRYTQSNIAVAQFTLAVNRPYNPQTQQQEADFISCVVWKKQAENLHKYCKKGSQIAVEGRIQTRKYQNNEGKNVYITEVLCGNITFLDSKPKTEGQQVLEQIQEQVTSQITSDPFQSFGEEVTISEEDIPWVN